MKRILIGMVWGLGLLTGDWPTPATLAAEARPNVIYIMADELGYYEPGFNGGSSIRTPQLDRLAAEGMRFTNLFAGSSVCAPTRCCLLTGKHSGHTSVRVNGGGTPLRADEVTIASLLKRSGYATGGFGKWGCGGRDSTGVPEKQGFDLFFGYYDQVHAHTYYPPYLIRNSEEVVLAGNRGGSQGTTYAQYRIHAEALAFIRQHGQDGTPFFAYLPYTPPHGNFDIPDTDPAWEAYRDQPWPEPARRYAAMVSMLDRQVGEIRALLQELNLEKNTLIFFSGDNGGADYFVTDEHPRGVHSANKHPQTGVEFRGRKGLLYEGGLRVPFVAHWPGRIAAGRVSEHLAYFPDILPTIAEVTGAIPPRETDGISLVPTLLGEKAGRPQELHPFLYWELGEQTAIRQGNWRAVRPRANAAWELYDLSTDPSEAIDLASSHPNRVAELAALAASAHQPAIEGTFTRTERHERDRRAKFGQHDQPPTANPRNTKQPKRKAAVMPKVGMLSQQDWKIVRVSSENVANQRLARHAIDGDPQTHWHTQFSPSIAPPPHELVIDLGASRTIRGFVYLARQDGGWNGVIKEVEFAIGSSPDQLAKPLIRTKLEKTQSPQTVSCPVTVGRYLLLRAYSEYGDGTFASMAELGVVGE